jgi:hypothetical protein
MAKDDIDFDAYMRDRGVQRIEPPAAAGNRPGMPAVASSDPKIRAQVEALQRALQTAQAEREATKRSVAAAQAELDAVKRSLMAAQADRDEAHRGLAVVQAERDETKRSLMAAQAERDALAKERAALQRQVTTAAAVPAPLAARTSLREALWERGVEDETEAAELLLVLLDRNAAELLDALEARPEHAERLLGRLALVCERPECQPESPQAVVVRVSPERCEVCGGSDIRVAFDLLLRASRRAGVTRLVIVGGSPPYHTQLRDLARGTDLKLDLVSGHSKPGRRRARNDAERVVIWGATILDHGTSAAYDHLGDRLIRVTHRGISGMLREVAETLG